jgi:hypothetical protein
MTMVLIMLGSRKMFFFSILRVPLPFSCSYSRLLSVSFHPFSFSPFFPLFKFSPFPSFFGFLSPSFLNLFSLPCQYMLAACLVGCSKYQIFLTNPPISNQAAVSWTLAHPSTSNYAVGDHDLSLTPYLPTTLW